LVSKVCWITPTVFAGKLTSLKCEPVLMGPALPKPETCAQLVMGVEPAVAVAVGADWLAVVAEGVTVDWLVGVVPAATVLLLQALSNMEKSSMTAMVAMTRARATADGRAI
jgi:hypothetical protein